MPHITLEYTHDMIRPQQLSGLLDALYAVVVATGLFDERNIKLRSLGHEHYRLGGGAKGFLHVMCRIHAGRSQAQQKALSQALVDCLEQLDTGVSVITCEVVEMSGPSYSKWSQG